MSVIQRWTFDAAQLEQVMEQHRTTVAALEARVAAQADAIMVQMQELDVLRPWYAMYLNGELTDRRDTPAECSPPTS